LEVVVDMTHISRNQQTVVPLEMDNFQEPIQRQRHSTGGKLETNVSEDFHRRLSLDDIDPSHFSETYCDHMSGVELDKMKDVRDSMFPLDKRWPFLLRVPANIFGMSMGVGSQSIVWKAVATQPSMAFLKVPPLVSTIIWFFGIVLLIGASIVYALKVCRWPQAVYREFVHPVRSNFLVAPFLSALLLLLGAPTWARDFHERSTLIAAFVFSVPVVLLEIHFYGHWLMGGNNRRLSAMVNPTTQISVIGNFISATVFGKLGWNDLALYYFSVGFLHQLVVFQTIYMRLPSNTPLHNQLHPVLFLFVAPPSTAATAWIAVNGSGGQFTKILTFLGLFLYLLLVSRVNHLVRGVRFSLAWWAYTFPMGAAALAAMEYANVNHAVFAKVLATGLTFVASATVLFVVAFTVTRSFTGELFPNDEVVGVCLTTDPTIRNEVSQFSNPSSAAATA
jgi:tellurite resistance protein TehA-like permease